MEEDITTIELIALKPRVAIGERFSRSTSASLGLFDERLRRGR
jgi:hypothetical protein